MKTKLMIKFAIIISLTLLLFSCNKEEVVKKTRSTKEQALIELLGKFKLKKPTTYSGEYVKLDKDYYLNSSSTTKVCLYADSENVVNEYLNSNRDIVLYFTASWCGPCRMISPEIIRLSNMYTDVDFIKINVDELSDLAISYKVSALPTFHFLDGGTIWGFKHVGANIYDILNYIKNIRANN